MLENKPLHILIFLIFFKKKSFMFFYPFFTIPPQLSCLAPQLLTEHGVISEFTVYFSYWD